MDDAMEHCERKKGQDITITTVFKIIFQLFNVAPEKLFIDQFRFHFRMVIRTTSVTASFPFINVIKHISALTIHDKRFLF